MPAQKISPVLQLCLLTAFLLITAFTGGNFSSFGDPVPPGLTVSTFDIDVTPPAGSHLAYDPMVNTWDLGLRAKGIVLMGDGQPIVLCAVDWIGIANDSHDAFRAALAEAAGTIPERVAIHTVHQHDSPESDFGAERFLKEKNLDPRSFEGSFQREVISRLSEAVRKSVGNAQPVTHIGHGQARVYQVASNRRILGPDGKVKATRYSSCRDSALRAEPEGLIDPMVSLVSFWNLDKPVAVLSYYANHPMSYYRTGIPNPDYPGIARFMRQLEVPQALHIHFSGAGGNLTAGKYNDGSRELRGILAGRLADGMKRAWEETVKVPVSPNNTAWNFVQVSLPPAPFIDSISRQMGSASVEDLANNLSKVIWLKRLQVGRKLDVSCLSLGDIRILHMPGELFVEYQLAAKKMRSDLFVTMAAYGDYATGYICTAKAYSEGGYESGRASGVTAEAEGIMLDAISKLLKE